MQYFKEYIKCRSHIRIHAPLYFHYWHRR